MALSSSAALLELSDKLREIAQTHLSDTSSSLASPRTEGCRQRKRSPPTLSEKEDVLARAEQLRKSLRKNPKQDSSDDYVVITVCEMVEKSCGGFQRKRKGPSVEMTNAQRSDSYQQFARKGAVALNLESIPNSPFCLFKAVGGAVIADKDLMVNKRMRPWTLGNYLLLLKKSPANVKIGIGYKYGDNVDSEESGVSFGSLSTSQSQSKKQKHDVHIVGSEDTPQDPVTFISDSSKVSAKSCASKQCVPRSIELGSQVQRFDHAAVLEATDNFSSERKLGAGGFGEVFKGILNGTFVAVKRLSVAGTRGVGSILKSASCNVDLMDQLHSEIAALSRCRHRNLVELMGFCYSPPILIYEFMEKGSLYNVLHKVSPPSDWQQRSKILKDVCRGLLWLHSASPSVVHGDLNSSNILVDKYFNGKIGDFGFTENVPCTSSSTVVLKTAKCIAKSLGYAAPEIDVHRHSVLTDMYSYGIVVLETYSNSKAYDKTREDNLLVEHFEEALTDVTSFSEINFVGAGTIAPYLVQLYYKIASSCVKKHSARPASEEVMKWWNQTNF